MQIAPGTFCPLIKEDCIQAKCMFWTKLYGKHPQTGSLVDEWDCAIKWLPLLMIENTKETIGVASSIDSFRNEVARGQHDSILRLAKDGVIKDIAFKEVVR